MTNMGFEYRNTTRKNKCRIMGHTQQRVELQYILDSRVKKDEA